VRRRTLLEKAAQKAKCYLNKESSKSLISFSVSLLLSILHITLLVENYTLHGRDIPRISAGSLKNVLFRTNDSESLLFTSFSAR
jgi:hypothetical protein